MNCPQTLQGGNTYYNPLIEGEIESENVEQGNCVSRVGASMHIRKKNGHLRWKGTCLITIFELHTISP